MPSLLPPPETTAPLPAPPRAARAAAPAAAWLASAGALLVLIAAGVVVVGQWTHIAPVYKLGGLIVLNALVLAVATLLQRLTPVAARSLAHLGALLAVPSGVAFVAAAHRTWPAAIVVGGACGLAACLVQAKRWQAPWLILAAEASLVFGLAGLATLTHTPIGVLSAATAVGSWFLRRQDSAGRFAAAAVLAPVVGALGKAGVGSGTFVRMGAAGPALGWAAPVAGIAAGGILLLLAQNRRNTPIAVAGLLSIAVSVPIGLGALHSEQPVWWSMPGLVILATMIATASASDRFWLRILNPIREVCEAAIVVGALCAAALYGFIWSFDGGARPVSADWVVVAAVSAAAAIAGALMARRMASQPKPLPAPGTASYHRALATKNARSGQTRVDLLDLAATAIALTALCTVSTRLWVLIGAAIVASVFAATRPKLFTSNQQVLTFAAMLAPCAVVTGSARFAAFVALAGVAATAVRLGSPSKKARIVRLALASVGTAQSIDAMWSQGPWPAVTWLGLLLGLTFAARFRFASISGLAVFAALVAQAAGSSSTETTIGLVIASIVLIGAATVVDRQPLDVLSLSTTATATIWAFTQHDTRYWSIGGLVAGATLVLFGALRQHPPIWWVGQVTIGASAVSVAFTTGFATWLGLRARNAGMSDADLWVLFVTLVMIGGGIWLRHRLPATTSWIAYAPGLGLAATHLVSSEVALRQPGRLALALGVGIVSLALGAARKLAAPLVIGSCLTAASVVVATGNDLASLPVWVWLAVGGVALLVLAVVIERREPGASTRNEPGRRLIEVIWATYR